MDLLTFDVHVQCLLFSGFILLGGKTLVSIVRPVAYNILFERVGLRYDPMHNGQGHSLVIVCVFQVTVVIAS